MEKDGPPDITPYARPAIPEDFAPGGRPALPQLDLPSGIFPTAFVRDVVVSNTNPNLTNTDTANDGEPSIAIDPNNTNRIIISAFSGTWGANSPLWESNDGGSTWTERFTVPVPPGLPAATTNGCPCDQAFDFDRSNRVSGTFLSSVDIYSGTTTDATMSGSWSWLLNMGVAQRTNSVTTTGIDQPWLLVNRDPTTSTQDNIYVAYDELTTNSQRVAVSLGTNPPNFVRDNLSGNTGGGFVNPGHRLAVDPSNGAVYSLWQVRTGAGDDSTHNISYRLNRSTDGGQTWTLNGNGGGIAVATGDSTQACNAGCAAPCANNTFKFGTVNALLGGVLHAAVDPTNSDVYYVYGNRDSATNNNRLAIRRLTSDGSGGLNTGGEVFVTGQVQAALPSVSVASDGTVGVLYTQFDGLSAMSSIPMFSVHFAMSTDQGQTFPIDLVLENFLSSATDSGACRQRVLGDYQQVKAVGTTFFGVFTGNGVPFGRTTANHDPIFFKVQTDCTITCPANVNVSNDPGQCGAVVNYPAPNAVSCGTVTCSPPAGTFFPLGTTTVNCSTQAGPACSFTVTVNDTENPVITCPANITVGNDPGLCSAIVNPGTATATDNCPGVTVLGTRSDGQALNASYPVGLTTITWKATDAVGRMATCAQTVTVNDLEPPVITASVGATCLWPPSHDLVDVGLSLAVSDNCTPAAQIAIDVKVTSDERAEEAGGDGKFSPDAVVSGTGVNRTIKLRRERVGGRDGRVYFIRITATDQYNNASLKMLRVDVPSDQGSRGGTCATDSRPVPGADAPDGGFFVTSPPAPVIGSKN
ncbi:MAG: HYR domain-containing protein [Chthoniobacterales bacterium]